MLMRILVVEDERDLNRVISKRLESEGYSIRFSVKDEGIGIAEYDLKKIWDRFYQVDPARSNSDGSMGLGLAMVKQIAQCHNGKVWAESKSNSGSTFIFTMPCE